MEGRERLCNGNEDVNVPAMQAVMKQATLPATKARKATRAKSDFLDGANVPIPAMAAPIDPGFENPHSAYVAIVAERFYDHKKKKKIISSTAVQILNLLQLTEMLLALISSDSLA